LRDEKMTPMNGNHKDLWRYVEGHQRTLYGEDGRGGLVEEVRTNSYFRKLVVGGLLFLAAPVWAIAVKLLLMSGGN